jgi:hypothetical protein
VVDGERCLLPASTSGPTPPESTAVLIGGLSAGDDLGAPPHGGVARGAKTPASVALGPPIHGKEGVDGSSPSEGSAKAPGIGAFAFRSTCCSSNARWVWSRLWSFHASARLRHVVCERFAGGRLGSHPRVGVLGGQGFDWLRSPRRASSVDRQIAPAPRERPGAGNGEQAPMQPQRNRVLHSPQLRRGDTKGGGSRGPDPRVQPVDSSVDQIRDGDGGDSIGRVGLQLVPQPSMGLPGGR